MDCMIHIVERLGLRLGVTLPPGDLIADRAEHTAGQCLLYHGRPASGAPGVQVGCLHQYSLYIRSPLDEAF